MTRKEEQVMENPRTDFIHVITSTWRIIKEVEFDEAKGIIESALEYAAESISDNNFEKDDFPSEVWKIYELLKKIIYSNENFFITRMEAVVEDAYYRFFYSENRSKSRVLTGKKVLMDVLRIRNEAAIYGIEVYSDQMHETIYKHYNEMIDAYLQED